MRNDHITRILTGDVYHSNKMISSVELKIGPIGILIPLRGLGQTTFSCSITSSSQSIIIHNPKVLPNIIEFVEKPSYGLLLSNLFILPVLNVQTTSVSLEYKVEKPLGEAGNFIVREINHSQTDKLIDTPILIPSGQTIAIGLELVSLDTKYPFLSCRGNRPFIITVTPSRGQPVKVNLQFQCRKQNESFLMTYIDHDHSVSQAAVIFPYSTHQNINNGQTCSNNNDNSQCYSIFDIENKHKSTTYPVLLTLHGSGIQPGNHADSYKVMSVDSSEYRFGLSDHWVLAPARFGAHNWEAIGELSAKRSLHALQEVIRDVPLNLPQVSTESAIAAGHSMVNLLISIVYYYNY